MSSSQSTLSEYLNTTTDITSVSDIIMLVILDGTYFVVRSMESQGKIIRAKCQLCKKENIISGGLTTTTNFLTHLKRAHPDSVSEYEERKKVLGPALKKRRNVEIGAKDQPSKQNQSTLTSSGFTISTKRKPNKTDILFLNFVVTGMHPLSTIEEPGFLDLVRGLNPNIDVVSRRTLGRQMAENSVSMKSAIMKTIQEFKFFCLTMDTWTCKGMSRAFFGVTIHWINEELERRSKALACTRFSGKHSFDKIGKLFCSTLQLYEIPLEKIIKVVTDNGSNFLKAFSEYGHEEVLNPLDDEEDLMNTEGYEDLEFINIDEVMGGTTPDDASTFRLPAHISCASHTLSLLCTTDIAKINVKLQKSAFAKCYGIWNKVSRSAKSSEKIKQICGRLLIKPCPTRWNSLYDGISCLLKLKEKLKDMCEALELPKFSTPELDFLQEYKHCLKPIAIALDRLQGDQNSYFGELIPTLLTVQKKLNELIENDLIFCKPLVVALKTGLNKRFVSYMDLSRVDAVVASVSHPYFKLRWVTDEKVEQIREILIKQTYEHFVQKKKTPLHAKHGSPEISVLGPSTSTLSTTKELSDEFFSFKSCTSSDSNLQEQQTTENKIRLECHQYLADDNENINMLSQYPAVKDVFIKFNTTLPSSAPVERLFNYAGMILSLKRRVLSDSTFERLLLLKVNGLYDSS